MIYNIFYDTNKNINWCSSGDVTAGIISDQASVGLSHLALDLAQIPACDDWYINNTEDGVVAYHSFDLTFSATTIALDGTITITGCPASTEIFLDNVSAGTYSSGDLTLTGSMSGSFQLKFVKDKYYDIHQQIIVARNS
tara:strand:- start:197 stop:613 length:417 start_codon:yes stop_codon:yes gene_type:complete